MFKNIVLVLLAASTLNQPAWSQEPDAVDVSEQLEIEEAPIPEPPYPGAESGEFAADKSAVKTYQAPEFPRPVKVDDEGNYYYGTNVPLPVPSNHPDIEKPNATAADGEFQYTVDSKPPAPIAHPGIEQPITVKADGDYLYQVEASPRKGGASFRLGMLTPPKLQNRVNGLKFEEIYSRDPLFTLFLDYDWRIFSSSYLGRLSLKFGSGLTFTNGQGRFKDPSRINEAPVERFNFILFPNQLTAAYKFQFADTQVLVPYVEGGAGYFTYTEIRDDAKKVRFGATPVAVAAGGVNFLLDWLDQEAIRSLDASYGINHLWLTAEVRQIVGLRSDFDFTSTSFNAGFLVEF